MINQPQCIIHSKAGHKAPEALFAAALMKAPTAAGFAVRDTTDGKVTLESDKFNTAVTLENMMLLNTNSEKYETVFYTANLPGVHTKDDVQPYILTIFENDQDTVGRDILATFLEGDFPEHVKEGHTDEYNFYNEVILPKLQDAFIAAEQDMAKFIASLHKPSFEKLLKSYAGHRCDFVFLPLEGELVKFGNNELGKADSWGSCSQHLDFDKVAKPITSVVQTAAAAVKRFNPFAKPGSEEPGEVNTEKVNDQPAGVHSTNATAKPLNDPIQNAATAINAGKKLVKPPPGLDKTARNRWLRLMNNGDLPPRHDHKDFEGIWVTPDVLPYAQRQNITTVAQVDALGAEMRTGIKKSQATPVQPVQDVNNFIPTLSDAEITLLTGAVAKLIDRKNIPTVLDIQKMEAPWPTLSEKAGIPFEDTYRWSIGEAMTIGHKALAMLWLETRRHLMSKVDVKDLIGTAAKEADKHIEAKAILGPDGTVAKEVKTVADKRAALFGLKATG